MKRKEASNNVERCRPSKGDCRISSIVQLWLLVLVGVLWMSLTSCACGFTSWHASIGIVPIFFWASILFFGGSRASRLEQVLGAAAYALVLSILLKNIADMVIGHP